MVICGVVSLCLILSKRPFERRGKIYLTMLLLNTLALIFDVIALIFRGQSSYFTFLAVRIANFVAFASSFLLGVSFIHYLTVFLEERAKVSLIPLKLCRIFCIFSLVLLVITQFYPIYYSINYQNLYQREKWFWLSHLGGFLTMVIGGWLLYVNRVYIEKEERVAFGCYIIMPVVALSIQNAVYGLALLNLANTISLVIAFLFLQMEQGRKMAEQERQLIENRISIMLSQIQPHFLFNTLNTIGYLCEHDARIAKKAVDDFATYLRCNLDSIRHVKPIPFEKELEHIQIYLSLEKMRFDDELQVFWEIETTDFLIPPLSVQPLVENAVKYGVGKKKGGGCITISSSETISDFVVEILDDGVGYDTSAVKEDGRSHIGIQNVKERIDKMMKGSLEIYSQNGIGTRALIKIPKEEKI